MRFRAGSSTTAWIFALCFTGAAGNASAVAGQSSLPVLRLGPVTAEAAEGFTRIRNLRELSDGQVLVPDMSERALYRIDFGPGGDGRVQQIGRRGQGPNEYAIPSAVFALSGDSTLMVDGLRRWYLLEGIEFIETLTQRSPVTQQYGHFRGVTGSAALDMVGVRWRENAAQGWRETADSVALRLVQNPWSNRDGLPPADTIPAGMVGAGPAGFPGCSTGAGRRGSDPLARPRNATRRCGAKVKAEDRALLFPDGWIAVARLDPYRVDWRTPEGRWIRGDGVDPDAPTMGNAERCAAAQRWNFRGVGSCSDADLDDQELPEQYLPFVREGSGARSVEVASTLLAAPDGRLLVRRTPTSRDFMFTKYDIFDRNGARVGRIQLPGDQAILGFGSESVYSVWTDEYDLLWVRRHDWPPAGG